MTDVSISDVKRPGDEPEADQAMPEAFFGGSKGRATQRCLFSKGKKEHLLTMYGSILVDHVYVTCFWTSDQSSRVFKAQVSKVAFLYLLRVHDSQWLLPHQEQFTLPHNLLGFAE